MKEKTNSSNSKYTAIVCDVHYRMSLAVIRDLAEAGVKVIAVEFNHKQPPLGFYSKHVFESLLMDEDNYLDELYSLCQSQYKENGRKPVIINVGNATTNLFTEETKKRFSEVAGFCIAHPAQLELLNDKKRLSEIVQSCGVPVPTEYAAPYDEASYPCVVKPLCGEKYGLKAWDRYKIVNSRVELESAVENFKKLCGGEIPVVQQYIQGSGFGCEFFAEDGKLLSHICHERIREYPVSGGPSACCRSVHIPKLSEYSESVCSKLGFTGPAMFEFKKGSDGEYYFLECNPRVWGSYPLVRAAESNISLFWFKSAYEKANPGEEFIFAEREYKDVTMHFLLSDIFAGLGYLKRGEIGKGLAGIFSWLNPSIKNGLFEINDSKPAWVYLKSKI